MKKILISLLLLVILGGAVFFFGWVSFRLDSEEYGVAFTKSDGWIAEPVEPGSFTWMWQALVPTNLTLHAFPLTPKELEINESGTLPSAELYARYVEGEPEFTYDLELTVRYRIMPAELASALAEERTTPEGMESYTQSLESSLRSAAKGAAVTALEGLGRDPEVGALLTVTQSVRDNLRSQLSELEILEVSVASAEIPDLFVYNTARENYRAIQEGRRSGLRETARDAAAERVIDEERRRALEEYGRILQEYPVLLDYFRLIAESGADPLNLELLQSALQENE